jgi:hypothetical protein
VNSRKLLCPVEARLCWFGMLALVFAAGCKTSETTRFETIDVRGTPRFRSQVNESLSLLKARAPESFQIVTNQIAIIQQAKHSGMKAYKKRPKFELAPPTAFYSLTWCAGSIVHDACHSKLYHDFLNEKISRTVPDSVWTGEAAENYCSAQQLRALQALGAPVNEIKSCQQTNRYWDVKYKDRSW